MSATPSHAEPDRLVALEAGLLDDVAEARLRAHLDLCSECRDSLAALRRREPWDGAPGEHLPESLVAGWPRLSRTLRGIERDAVAGHLETCASCREEIVLLGHEPLLSPSPAVTAVLGHPADVPDPPSAGALGTPAPVPARAPMRVLRLETRRDWVRVAFAGWAVAATAAAVFLLVVRPTFDSHPAGNHANVSASIGVVPMGDASTPGQTAQEGGVTTCVLAPGQRVVVLPLPALGMAKARLTLEVDDREGHVVASARTAFAGDANAPLALPLDVGDPPLPEGDYVLVLRAEPADGGAPVERTLRFRLAR